MNRPMPNRGMEFPCRFFLIKTLLTLKGKDDNAMNEENENAASGAANSKTEKDMKLKEEVTQIVTQKPQAFKLIDVFNIHNNRLPTGAGIYGIKDESGNLIYVGMSENLSFRFYRHTHGPDRRGLFNCQFSKKIYESLPVSLFWQVCAVPLNLSREELLKVEELLIRQFRPEHNRAHFRRNWTKPSVKTELF